MCLKYNYHLRNLPDPVEASKLRQNESNSLRTKKADYRAKVEGKLKEIPQQSSFCNALVGVKESTVVEELLELDDQHKEMGSESFAKVESY